MKKQNSQLRFQFFIILAIVASINIVSAQGISTCIQSNDGKICYEYESSECDAQCTQACIPSPVSEVSECRQGICYDSDAGTCSYGSPRIECESNGGIWLESDSNPSECRKACCVLGGIRTGFVTERECVLMGTSLNLDKVFRTDITTADSCLALLQAQQEGACLKGNPDIAGKRNCTFVEESKCNRMGGEFYPGTLCSNPDLNTRCEKQKKSSCIVGRDEIYWFDSCGNKENIYDANRVRSWNDGKVLTKGDSCSIVSVGNILANQGTCGNCNYLEGSICGNKTATEHLDDSLQRFVCKKLDCAEGDGTTRKHGDSWCVYQGTKEDGQIIILSPISTLMQPKDLPGSNHFIKRCMNGEIITTPCGDARTSVCIQSINSSEGRVNAQCVPNEALNCLSYNNDATTMETKCNQNSQCALKNTNIDTDFNFNKCTPKYSVGISSSNCSIGTKTCTMTTLLSICLTNCDCLKQEFIDKMNDLCKNIGDCGAETNYIGNLTKNYDVILSSNKKTRKFTCQPWEAPVGGRDCEKCGSDGLPCNEYSCYSLGKGCIILNKDTSDESCTYNNSQDIIPPTISPNPSALSEGYQYINQAYGVNVRTSDGGCIPAYSPLNFGILLNKFGQCKYSTNHSASFDEMGQNEGINMIVGYFESYHFKKNFSMIMVMPSLEMLGESSYKPDVTVDYNIYVKCQSANGYKNTAAYDLNFCIKAGEGRAPLVIKTEPVDGLVAHNLTEKSVRIITDQPAECRWDANDKNYSLMNNNLTCANAYEDIFVYQGGVGWVCNATLPLGENESLYYVNCIDRPWETNMSKRHIMSENDELKLMKTPELEIISAIPDGKTLVFGVEPVAVKLKVDTKGGDGNAECYYSLDNKDYHAFFEERGNSHDNLFNSLLSGEHKFYVRCLDSTGNIAEKEVSFKVELDTMPPKIARVYQDQGDLIIKTEEEAECALSKDSCDFEFENGSSMTGTSTYHSFPIENKNVYYIKCKDKFGNQGGRCELKLKLI